MGLGIFKPYNQYQRVFNGKRINALMLGIDGAGKTTILHKINISEVVPILPTIGFFIEVTQFQKIKFTSWDLGRPDYIHSKMSRRRYQEDVQAIVFVLDASDTQRIDIAKEEFHKMINQTEYQDSVILVFANKQDCAKMTLKQIQQKLDIGDCKIPIHFQGCSASSGEGLLEGFNWLVNAVPHRSPK